MVWNMPMPALALAGIFMLVQSQARTVWMVGAARFLVFFAAGGLEPIMQVMLSSSVKPERRGTAFGWCASIRMFGGMFGALVGGGVIAMTGVRGVCVCAGILMFVCIPLMVKTVKLVEKSRQNK